ncbi:MAG: hypothetical protein IKT07_01955 [Oscillospiraceae bacterium]|nr:hypothetical protein [Oscillospiraceae bacterium]
MKPLTEMTSRELFCVLTGDGSFVQQTMLKNLLLEYKEKYPDRIGQFGEVDLAAIVREMAQEEA